MKVAWRLSFVVAAILSFVSPARAFKEQGHRAIEGAAYAALIQQGHAKELAALVKAGILEGHYPETDSALSEAVPIRPDTGMSEGKENVQGLRLASNFPDHSFDRQLQDYGQCFHFMAESGDVIGDSGTLADFGVTVGMEKNAYQRCVALADALVRGILLNPRQARDHHLDVYVLIHMIEDSFSGSHAERDSGWKIMYLKPWRLGTWIPDLFNPGGWKYHLSETHHGGLSEPRDSEYLADGCNDDVLVASTACLSERGRRAADAIAELLLLLAHNEGCSATGCKDLELSWNEYKKRHLAHVDPRYSAVLTPAQVQNGLRPYGVLGSSTYLEGAPRRTLALGLATDFNVGQALWLDADLFSVRNALARNELNAFDFFTFTIQLRVPLEDDLGQRPFGAATDFGFRIPTGIIDDEDITAYLSVHALRVAATAASVAPGIAQYTLETGFGGIGLDLVFLNKVWIGAAWPRKLWRLSTWSEPAWEDTYWTLKVGGVIDGFR